MIRQKEHALNPDEQVESCNELLALNGIPRDAAPSDIINRVRALGLDIPDTGLGEGKKGVIQMPPRETTDFGHELGWTEDDAASLRETVCAWLRATGATGAAETS